MSREKQIEEIANVIYDDPNTYDTYWRSHCERLAETIYNAGYRKQSEPISCGHEKGSEWISVDERLPEPFVSVLVYMPDETPHPTVREGFVNKRGRWYAGGFDRLPDEVVMWREMPEAPKMKGGAE